MKCKHIEIKLAAVLMLNEAEKTHLEGCTNCQNFSAILNQFTVQSLQTPEWLRMNTRLKALSTIQNSLKMDQVRSTTLRSIWRSPKTPLIFSTLFIAAFLASLFIQLICNENDVLCNSLKIFQIILFLQNISAALFVPIFFANKKIQEV